MIDYTITRLMSLAHLRTAIRELPPKLKSRLAATLRKAISEEELMLAKIITIQLMGSDVGPEDDEVTVDAKAKRALRTLILMTGAKDVSWQATPRPSFSFRLNLPGAPIPRMGVKISLDPSDTYTLELSKSGSGKVMSVIRGIYANRLKRTFEENTAVRLGLR